MAQPGPCIAKGALHVVRQPNRREHLDPTSKSPAEGTAAEKTRCFAGWFIHEICPTNHLITSG